MIQKENAIGVYCCYSNEHNLHAHLIDMNRTLLFQSCF